MLSNNNGNLYVSDPNNGTSNRGYLKRQVPYGSRYTGKYKKFMDMPLSAVQKKQVQKMAQRKINFNRELKYIDTTAIGQLFTQTLSANLLTGPLLGSADTARVGDELQIRNIELRYKCALQAGFNAVNGQQTCRIIVWQYYQDTALAAVNPLEVIQTSGNNSAYLSPYDHDARRLYKILYDESLDLDVNGTSSEVRTVLMKPGRQKVRFVGTSTTGEGHVYLGIVSDFAGTTNQGLFDFYARVNYYDS